MKRVVVSRHMIKKHIITMICVVLWLACPALLLPILPGLILVDYIALPRVRDNFLIWWGCVNISSFAFWAVMPWLSVIPGLRMNLLFNLAIGICIVIMMLRPVRICVPEKTSIFQLAFILVLFGIPFFTRIAFGSGDMTMHMYMASIIKYHNAIPNTYEPLLAIPQFGQYPIGFHVILSYVSTLSGLPIYRAALLLGCYVFHLLFLALCAQFGERSKNWPVFVAVFMFVLFSHYPQFMFQWGSATTALSLTFLLILFPIMRDIGRVSIREIPVAALIGSAALICQPIPFFGFLLYFPVYYLVMNGIPSRKAILNLAIFLVVAGAFCVGMILRLPNQPDAYTLGRVQEWNLSQLYAVHPFMEKLTGLKQLSSFDIPAAYIFILGVFTSVLSFFAVFFVKDSRIRTLYFSFLAVSFAVLLSKIYPFLPFNYALYPERVLVFMGIPIVLLYEQIFSLLKERQLKVILSSTLVLFCASFMSIREYPYKSYYRLLKEKMISPAKFVALSFLGADYITYAADDILSGVTKDDIIAINWIKDNVPKGEVIDCDYNSFGHLIPIIAGNKILRPHYSFEFYKKYIESWQKEQNVKYVYVGSGSLVASEDSPKVSGKEVFRHGKAAVYLNQNVAKK